MKLSKISEKFSQNAIVFDLCHLKLNGKKACALEEKVEQVLWDSALKSALTILQKHIMLN